MLCSSLYACSVAVLGGRPGRCTTYRRTYYVPSSHRPQAQLPPYSAEKQHLPLATDPKDRLGTRHISSFEACWVCEHYVPCVGVKSRSTHLFLFLIERGAKPRCRIICDVWWDGVLSSTGGGRRTSGIEVRRRLKRQDRYVHVLSVLN